MENRTQYSRTTPNSAVRRRMWTLLPLALSLLVASVPATASAAQGCSSLLDAIRARFQKHNPNIEHVQVIDTKPRLSKHWVLVRGIRQDRDFKGSFDDELFGLFIVDDDFESVEKVIDIFPTKRWADYEIWIDSYSLESIMLRGHGATYEDNGMEKAYEVSW